MSTIVDLEIKNFRGIEHLKLNFSPKQNLICFIGRGDSGKTTILEAISSVLSSNWNLNFTDTDFYNCDVTKNIEISATIINFPNSLLSDNRFGLYMRAYNKETQCIEDKIPLSDMDGVYLPALSISLTIDSSLEPQWFVASEGSQENKPISSKDRAIFNCYLISDYLNKHFSWSRGNPLHSVLKQTSENTDSSLIIEQLRKAKVEIDKNSFTNLDASTKQIIEQAKLLGLDISSIKTTLDSKDLLIKDSKISLHDQSVPYRLKGKGTKRLISMAIQSTLVRDGGMMLVDEVEQGLEPDRAKQAVRALLDHRAGQIFITTHSREIITELGSAPLHFLIRNKANDSVIVKPFNEGGVDLQKTVRACPEAFFSKKVIVCEGATEVGICRAIDKWRLEECLPQMAVKDCAYIDGTGSTLASRVHEINQSGLKTALFCDSDLPEINKQKAGWSGDGVIIFDCDELLCLEQQIFKDMPWLGVIELLQYVNQNNSASFDSAFTEKNGELLDSWEESKELRQKIIELFKPRNGVSGKSWFKQLHHGEAVGSIIIKYLGYLPPTSKLKNIIVGLSNWVDGE